MRKLAQLLLILAYLCGTAFLLDHVLPRGHTQFTPPALPRTYADIATPSVNPTSGNTTVYTKSGTLCGLSPAGAETCTGTGGGGAATSSTAIGSEPGTPNTGDLDFYNNAPFIARWSGSAWLRWGPVYALTSWVDSGFSWVNQGTSTVSLTNGVLLFTGQTGGVGVNSLRVRVQATPAPPYTVTALIMGGPFGSGTSNQGQEAGLIWRNSGAATLATCGIQQFSNVVSVQGSHWTNPTTFSAAVASANATGTWAYWVRLRDDNANRICSYSFDGTTFIQIFSETRTTFLTPDQYGYYVNSSNNVSVAAYFLSILQN
jgi:hypothetical protein